MRGRYILRLDDIAPNMHWENYYRVKHTCGALNVRPLLGVIPDNHDSDLLAFPEGDGDFWEEIRRVRGRHWGIAQHGYQHRYVTRSSGILGICPRSEFAGLCKEEQREKLMHGRQILLQAGIETDIFMAPSHSFDWNTLEVLRETGFTTVTDGFGLFPYCWHGLTFVPVLCAGPYALRFGVYTFCLHLNEMDAAAVDRLERFLKLHADSFISFSQARQLVSRRWLNRAIGEMIHRTLQFRRKMRSPQGSRGLQARAGGETTSLVGDPEEARRNR